MQIFEGFLFKMSDIMGIILPQMERIGRILEGNKKGEVVPHPECYELCFGELILADSADGTNPIFGEFVERFSFFAGVVFVPANVTNVLCHRVKI